MPDLAEKVVDELGALGFELQPTSFESITREDEIAYIRTLASLPDCDSSKILQSFPDYFAAHKKAKPEAGMFFVVLASNVASLPTQASKIYDKYFPPRVLVVGEAAGVLVARWHHSQAAPEPIIRLLKRECGI